MNDNPTSPFATLTSDGDTVTVDGTTYRLRVEPDAETVIDDFDTYGRVAPVPRNPYGYNSQRPEGFDGNAEKITVWGGPIWWQPPADVRRTDEHFAALRQQVIDVVSFGFVIVFLERLDGTDAYGDPIVVDYACLGGVEALADDAYLATIVTDLACELGAPVS